MNVRLAKKNDDAALRALLSTMPMPGPISVSFRREPDYFVGTSVPSLQYQTLLLEDDDDIRAMCCRSVHLMHINGVPSPYGYLSGLRLSPGVRSGMVLARGYREIKKLHGDNACPAYLSTIVESNHTARTILTSGRVGLPAYRDLGQYRVYTVPVGRRRKGAGRTSVVKGDSRYREELVHFLNSRGRTRQFYPVYASDSFTKNKYPGFAPEDFRILKSRGGIRAVAGIWDQTGFKQNFIEGYSGILGVMRPVLSSALRLGGYSPLPRPQSVLCAPVVSFIGVEDNRPEYLHVLLEHIHDECRDRGFFGFAVGFHERDPLRAALKGFPSINYVSRLYIVHWPEQSASWKKLNRDLVPYLEVGLL